MSLQDRDIDGMMQHLETVKTRESPSDGSGCPNCQLPPSKRNVKKINVGSQEVDLKRVCPECYTFLDDPGRPDSINLPEIKWNEIEREYIVSGNGTFHLIESGDEALCGYENSEKETKKVPRSRICGGCREIYQSVRI